MGTIRDRLWRLYGRTRLEARRNVLSHVQPTGATLVSVVVDGQSKQASVRLAEVVGSLSLATDLAHGQALEHGLRRALLAVWLGEDLGLRDEELSTVY